MNWKHVLVSTATVTLLAACASKQAPAPVTGSTGMDGQASTVTPGTAGQNTVDPLRDPNSPLSKRSVFFDFDSSVVKGDGQTVVNNHSAYLKSNSQRKVTIQGNTDVRGSREYNLGLGQRRAESVKRAMQVLGVPESQLEAVSFGKEKPRATGNTEADHAQNRRADIAYDGE